MSARAATAIATLVGFVGVLALPTAAEAAPRNNAPVVVAHRGASGYAPENTLQAIDKADKLGFDWVENDVQRTKDGRLVVIHDTNLARTTNVEQVFPGRAPYNVRDFTAAEIAKLDAGRWKGAKFKGARVPTLTQYLDRVDHNHQKLLMEVKNPELYPGIERTSCACSARRAGSTAITSGTAWWSRASAPTAYGPCTCSAPTSRRASSVPPP